MHRILRGSISIVLPYELASSDVAPSSACVMECNSTETTVSIVAADLGADSRVPLILAIQGVVDV